MTVSQALECIRAWEERQAEECKTFALLLDGQARQIASRVAAMMDKKNKYLTLEKLYPAWFGRKTGLAQVSREEQEAAFQRAFRSFLGR